MENTVTEAIKSLEHSRKYIEDTLKDNQQALEALQKQISENNQHFFGKIKNLFLCGKEKELLSLIDYNSKKIAKYKEAEQGLKNNSYEPAIKLLSEVAANLEESIFWDTGFLFGPRAMRNQVLELRNKLINLTNK